MSGQGPKTLLALTGARFVAAMHVVLLHLVAPLLSGDTGWLATLLDRGYAGVEFFFVLSGFVLAYVHEEVRDAPAFWLARFARVYPTYLVAFALYAPFAVASAGHNHQFAHVALSGVAVLFLLQSWYPWAAYAWNPPGWSLSVEAVFYAVFPLIRARLGRVRALVPALVLTWLVSLLAPLAYMRLQPDGAAVAVDHNKWFDFFWVFPLFRLPDFVFGVLLGVAFLRAGRTLSPRVGAALSLTGAAILLVVIGGLRTIDPILLHLGLLLPAFGMVIFGLAIGGGPLAAWLSRPEMVALGEASYALYVLQTPIAMFVQSVSKRALGEDLSDWRVAAAAIVIMLVASGCAYKWFEVPARRAIRGWRGAARTAPSAT
jgi:peptidoglycan/LPS O-acetylase OafA/YrhL